MKNVLIQCTFVCVSTLPSNSWQGRSLTRGFEMASIASTPLSIPPRRQLLVRKETVVVFLFRTWFVEAPSHHFEDVVTKVMYQAGHCKNLSMTLHVIQIIAHQFWTILIPYIFYCSPSLWTLEMSRIFVSFHLYRNVMFFGKWSFSRSDVSTVSTGIIISRREKESLGTNWKINSTQCWLTIPKEGLLGLLNQMPE